MDPAFAETDTSVHQDSHHTLLHPPKRYMTDEELMRFCEENEIARVERDVDGEILVMSAASSRTGRKNAYVSQMLANWADQHGGYSFDSSTGFTLPDGSMRMPDASWVQAEIWDALSEEDKDRFSPICPTFVIEIRSKTDRLKTLESKMGMWLANGAQVAWLIDPERKVVSSLPAGRTRRAAQAASLSARERADPGVRPRHGKGLAIASTRRDYTSGVNLTLAEAQLPVRLRFESPMTDDQLLHFCAANDVWQIEPDSNGEILVRTPAGFGSSSRNLRISRLLDEWAEVDGRGAATGPDGGYVLPGRFYAFARRSLDIFPSAGDSRRSKSRGFRANLP